MNVNFVEDSMTTLAQALTNAQQKLMSSLSDAKESRLDAEVLLAFVLNCDRSYLFTWPEQTLSSAQEKHFEKLIERRSHGEPIAYLIGKKEFWSIILEVNASALIPRPETELLVEVALQKRTNTLCKMLDLGTGTGAIALALAKERPLWQVVACDASNDAVTLAKRNAHHLQFDNVSVRLSDWFANIAEKDFDLIISNPPYIDEHDIHLTQGDLRFEPKSALVADNKGLGDISKIIQQAQLYLKSGAWLMLEHGFSQAEQVRKIFVHNGYADIETFNDLAGHQRVTIGKYVNGDKYNG